MKLKTRGWVPENCETRVQDIAAQIGGSDSVRARLDGLVMKNRDIHEAACFNLNPATNVMNPRAEAMLSSGIGSRPSLGYPGDKYEMGLEAIEESKSSAPPSVPKSSMQILQKSASRPVRSPTFTGSWRHANPVIRSSHPPRLSAVMRRTTWRDARVFMGCGSLPPPFWRMGTQLMPMR